MLSLPMNSNKFIHFLKPHLKYQSGRLVFTSGVAFYKTNHLSRIADNSITLPILKMQKNKQFMRLFSQIKTITNDVSRTLRKLTLTHRHLSQINDFVPAVHSVNSQERVILVNKLLSRSLLRLGNTRTHKVLT